MEEGTSSSGKAPAAGARASLPVAVKTEGGCGGSSSDAGGGASADDGRSERHAAAATAAFAFTENFVQDGQAFAVTMDQMNQIHTKLRETRECLSLPLLLLASLRLPCSAL